MWNVFLNKFIKQISSFNVKNFYIIVRVLNATYFLLSLSVKLKSKEGDKSFLVVRHRSILAVFMINKKRACYRYRNTLKLYFLFTNVSLFFQVERSDSKAIHSAPYLTYCSLRGCLSSS